MRVVITVLQEWIYFETITDARCKMWNRRTIKWIEIYKNRKENIRRSVGLKRGIFFYCNILGYCVIRMIII